LRFERRDWPGHSDLAAAFKIWPVALPVGLGLEGV
jgi:hypothetical protein